MTNVGKFYQEVIDNVIAGLRSDFDLEGVDAFFVEELKTLWQQKLADANVTGPEISTFNSAYYHGMNQSNAKSSYATLTVNRGAQQTFTAGGSKTAINSNDSQQSQQAQQPQQQQPQQQPLQPMVVPTHASVISRPAPTGNIHVPQPQTIAAIRPQQSTANHHLTAPPGQPTFTTVNTGQQGQLGAPQNVQLVQLAGGQAIVVPQIYLTQQAGQPGPQLMTTNPGQPQIRTIINSHFPNTQMDGKASDLDDSDEGGPDSDVDLMSEAPSSVRGPMSNMPAETPITRSGHGNASSYGRKHMNNQNDSDDDDFVPATPQTPRHNLPMHHDPHANFASMGTPMTPFSIASPDVRKRPTTEAHGSKRMQPRTPGGKKARKANSPGQSGDFNYANSDSEYEYEYDDDPSGMTPRGQRHGGGGIGSKQHPRTSTASMDLPLNLTKASKNDHGRESREDQVEVDDEGVPLKAAAPPQKKKSKKKETAAVAAGEDLSSDEDEAKKDEEEEVDEEPLNSGDDVSEEDTNVIFDTENVVVCQYDKITRSRNKWRFHFKDGIMSIRGRDHLFQKAMGEAEW